MGILYGRITIYGITGLLSHFTMPLSTICMVWRLLAVFTELHNT